jgi:FixJ family two-component response regulator
MPETIQPAELPHRGTVLLVEDDRAVRRSLQLLLHSLGYKVMSYGSVAPLLGNSSAGEAALLIADYRLPDGDGIGVLQELRGAGWAGRSILITAYPSPDLSEKARSAGFDVVLEKPVRRHDLVGALNG